MTSRIRNSLFYLSLIALTGVVFLLFSAATSPLYPNYYGIDSAFFRFFGAELHRGRVLYRDIWDNKGPVLFLIQAVGAWLGTRNTGINLIFLLQILSALFSVFCMDQADRLLNGEGRSRLRFLLITLCVYAVFCRTCEDGNLSEEWSVPFISFSLLLMIRYIYHAKENPAHPPLSAFFHGICLGLLALIRVNNAVSICAGLAVIGVYLILCREWKNLLVNIIAGIAGLAAVAIPTGIYFQRNNALYDMVYAVFLHNLRYIDSQKAVTFKGAPFFLRYIPIAAAAAILLIQWLRSRKISLPLIWISVITVANVILLAGSNLYLHYFTIFLPVFYLALILYARDRKLPETALAACVLGYFVFVNCQALPGTLALRGIQPKFSAVSNIPKEERKSAIAINLPPEIYLRGIEPVSRFCAYQSTHFAVAPDLKAEFLADLREKEPIWIIALDTLANSLPEVQTLLDSAYEPIYVEDNVLYYRIKTTDHGG